MRISDAAHIKSSQTALLFPIEPLFQVTHIKEYSPWQNVSANDLEIVQERIEDVWIEALKKSQKTLFNGMIANLVSYSPKLLGISFIEYKLFYAWQHDRFVRESLSIHPVGVSGITRYRGSVLEGRRSKKMAIRNDLYELVPSGSIDSRCLQSDSEFLDLSQMILHELFEEASIHESAVTSVAPRGLSWTLTDGIWDVVFDISINHEEKEPSISKINDEYQTLRWMPLEEIKAKVSNNSCSFVPLSALLVSKL